LQAGSVAHDGVAAGLYVANHRFASLETDYGSGVAGPSPLLHYWSLSLEEQFYVVWPALILAAAVLGRRRPAIVVAIVGLCAVASFVLCVRLTASSQPTAFFLLPSRAWELAVGALVALGTPLWSRSSARSALLSGWAGLAVVGCAVTTMSTDSGFPGPAALVPVVGTAAVLAAGTVTTTQGSVRLLRNRGLQYIGRHSYAWYLWHWPALELADAAAGHRLGLLVRLCVAAAAGAAAVGSSHLIEAPVRFSPLLARRAVWSLGVGVAVAVGTSAEMVTATSPLAGGGAASAFAIPTNTKARVPVSAPVPAPGHRAAAVSPAQASVTAAIAAGLQVNAVPSNLQPPLRRAASDAPLPFRDGCNDGYTDAGVRRCAYGVTTAATTIVLFGDSHAAQWFPAFEAAARQRAWRLVSLTKSTCPPVLLSIWSPVLRRPFRECDQWRQRVLARIRAERPALVVLGAARHYGPEYHFDITAPAWSKALHDMVAAVRATGAPVMVLGPTPKPGTNIPNCLSVHLRSAIQCTQPVNVTFHADRISTERRAVESADGTYFDVAPWLCDRQWCPVIVGNLLVYRDDNHLTTSYSAWLGPVVAEVLAARK
jgi:peptidoglycan/LPS O-acetylase OafA/YrhL